MPDVIVFYVVSPVHLRNAHLFAPLLEGYRLRIVYEGAASWFNEPDMAMELFETIPVRIGDVPKKIWEGNIKALVFSSIQPRPVPVELVAGALERGIPTIAIEESNQIALNQGRVNNYILPVDKVLVASEFERRSMISAGFPEYRFLVSGWPFYRGGVGKVSSEKKRIRKKALGLDLTRPVAALTLAWVHFADESIEVRKKLLSLAAEGLPEEYQLVIKPHPIEALDTLLPFIREYAPRAIAIDGKIPSEDLLEATDVLLNRGASQVCFEALLQNIPVILLDTGAKTLFHGLTEQLIVKDPIGIENALALVAKEENWLGLYSTFFKEHIPVLPAEAQRIVVENIQKIVGGEREGSHKGEQWFDIALYQAWLGEHNDAIQSVMASKLISSGCPIDELANMVGCCASREDLDVLKNYFGEGLRGHFLRCLWIRQLLICKDVPMLADIQWMESFPPEVHTVWFVKQARQWAFHLIKMNKGEAAKAFSESAYRRHKQVPDIVEMSNDIRKYLSGPLGRVLVKAKYRIVRLLSPIGHKMADWGLLNTLKIRR